MSVRPFELQGADGKVIRGDRTEGSGRQVLFITGFLSKRWGNKSKALAQWCAESGWGFCCYDARGFGDSEGKFTDYTLSDWIADARHRHLGPQEVTGAVDDRREFVGRLDRVADGAGSCVHRPIDPHCTGFQYDGC